MDGGADDEGVVAGDAPRAQRCDGGGDVTVDAQLDELAAQAGEEGGGAVEGDDAAVVDDGDAIAELLGLVEVVSGEQHGHSQPGPEAGDEIEDLEADARVQAHGGLVEKQHLRVRDERPGDLEPAALTTAVGVNWPIEEFAEAEGVDHVTDAILRRGRVESPQPGVHTQVAAAGEGPVDDWFLEDDRAHPARRNGI